MYLIKLLLFLNVGVLTLKAQDFSGGNNAFDENLKTVDTVVNHLNQVPEERYLFLRGRYVDSQLKGDILQLIADLDVTCKVNHPGVPCQQLTLHCTSFLKKDGDEKDYKVLSYTCSPKDEVSAEQVEISPTLIAAQDNTENIELSHEAIYTDQKADFVAVKSSYAPCLGCPFDLNTNAEGVTTLINTALRHLESERDRKHSLVKVIRLQEQIVAGVKYILLIEVSPTICPKNSDSVECPFDNNKSTEICEIVYFQKPWLSVLKNIVKNNCTVSQEFSATAETTVKEHPQTDAKEVTSDFLSELESQIVHEPPQIVVPSNLRPYKPQSIQKINEVREPTEIVPEYSPNYVINEEIATKQEDEDKVEGITKDTNEIAQEYTPASNIEQRTEINVQDKIEENHNGQRRLKRDTDEDTNETEESNSSEIRRPKRNAVEDTEETEESNSSRIRRPKRDTDENTNETEESDSSTIRRQKRDTDETNETTEEIEIRIKKKSHNSDSSSSSSSSDSDDDDHHHHHNSRKRCKNNDDSSSDSSSDSDDDDKSRNNCGHDDDSNSSSSSDSDDDENDIKSRKYHKKDDDSSSNSSSDSDDDNGSKCNKHKKNIDNSSSSSSSSDSDDEDIKKNKISQKHDCESDSSSSGNSCDSNNNNGNDVKIKKYHVNHNKPEDTNDDDDTNDIKSKNNDDYENYQKTKKLPKDYGRSYEQVEMTRKARSVGDYEGMSEDDRLEVKKLAKIAAKMLNQSKSAVKVLSAEKINMDGSYYKLKLRLDGVCRIIMHIDRNSEISMVKSQCHDKEKLKDKKRYRRDTNMPGGIVPTSVTPELKGFLNNALVYLDAQSTHPNKLKIVEILDASTQVVAGRLIRIRAKIAPSDCTKSDVEKDRDECGVLEDEPSKVCSIKIWDRPWLPKGRETTIDCSGDDKVHFFRSRRSADYASDAEINWDYTQLELFTSFITKHDKSYKNKYEFNYRYRVFKDNLNTIRLLNKFEQGTAVYGITKFADLTKGEFSRSHGLRFDLQAENEVPFARASIPDIDLPVEFDWRQKNAVTEVKNQGECGSCWAFSTTGNIEGQYAIKYNQLQEFSEQELVDCDTVDQGCNGGLMDNAYRMIEKLGGLELEKDYPYEAEDESCHFNKTMARVKLSGALNISHDETEMAKWLVKNGPISIAINANAMQFYMGGVSHPWKMLCNPNNLDHGVLIVGYGTHKYSLFNKTLPYWIVKNSWGQDWGEQGYYRVYRGDGTCGLNQTPSSAIVA